MGFYRAVSRVGREGTTQLEDAVMQSSGEVRECQSVNDYAEPLRIEPFIDVNSDLGIQFSRAKLIPEYVKPEALGIIGGGILALISFVALYILGDTAAALAMLGPLAISILGLAGIIVLSK